MIKKILQIIKRDRKGNDPFSGLYDLSKNGQPNCKLIYNWIINLDHNTSETISNQMIEEINQISYASNTNGYFYFFFPIVSHVVYYIPSAEEALLHLLIGPNYADGEDKVQGMTSVIQGAMNFKLESNSNYLSKEGQNWVTNFLPELKNEIKREIEKCIIENS